MNKYLKDALIFVGGLGSGILASYIFIKKKFEIISEEEIESVRQLYAERYPDDFSDGKAEPMPEDESKEIEEEPELVISETKRDKNKPPRKTIDYTSYYDFRNDAEPIDIAEMEHPEDDEYDRNYEDGLRETEKRAKSKGPKIIKAGDFGSAGYDEQTLLFYTQGCVLATEDDEILAENDLSEVEDMLGDAMTKYGFITSNEEKLYVRNDKRGCDYEIIKVFGRYET